MKSYGSGDATRPRHECVPTIWCRCEVAIVAGGRPRFGAPALYLFFRPADRLVSADCLGVVCAARQSNGIWRGHILATMKGHLDEFRSHFADRPDPDIDRRYAHVGV